MSHIPETSGPLLDYLQKGARFLSERGVESPRLSAELLLADLLATTRLDLYCRFEEPLRRETVDAFRERLRRRARHEPVAYILGAREFYGRAFGVDPRVLIPRPETEHVVEAALAHMRERLPGVILDVGTGSGILACTLLCECPDWRAVACAALADALGVARDNAARHGVADRLEFREGSLYTCTREENFAVIVSNPPYIRSDEWDGLPEQVKAFEPTVALSGGPDGLQLLRPLIQQAPLHLAQGGLLVCEIGAGQADAMLALATAAGLPEARVIADLAGKPRVLVAQRGGN